MDPRDEKGWEPLTLAKHSFRSSAKSKDKSLAIYNMILACE